jgi:hypothetical protein
VAAVPRNDGGRQLWLRGGGGFSFSLVVVTIVAFSPRSTANLVRRENGSLQREG